MYNGDRIREETSFAGCIDGPMSLSQLSKPNSKKPNLKMDEKEQHSSTCIEIEIEETGLLSFKVTESQVVYTVSLITYFSYCSWGET